jgi:hypothetical protein
MKEMSRIFVARMPRPAIVSPQDLVGPFLSAFVDRDGQLDYSRSVQSFLDQLKNVPVVYRRSDPIAAGTGPIIGLRQEETYIGLEPLSVWESESGFSTSLLCVLPASVGVGKNTATRGHTAFIQVEGVCSAFAFNAAIEEMKGVFSTLVKCGADLFHKHHNSETVRALSSPELTPEDILAQLSEVALIASDGRFGPFFAFLPDALQAYYSHPTKKDSIARRLTTAVRLLRQADMQAANGVGLALSVAAVEAMLCRKGSDLANLFAENVATLLEPEPRFRADAVRWCKKLYGLRSDVFHGNALDATLEDFEDARVLAAAVLKGMIERRNYVRRIGGSVETPDDLLEEMARDKYTPGQTTGVEESPIVSVWRCDG